MRITLAAVAGLAVAGTAFGQAFTITPGGLNAGNGAFQITTAQPTSLTTTGSSGANFRPTTLTSTPDQMFASWWWFRGAGDTREYTFANGSVAGGPTSAAVLVGNTTGLLDTGGYDYTVSNATAGYSFTSAQRWQIFAGAGGPAVVQSNTITNTGGSALSLAMFSYSDFDVNGTAGTDTYSYVGPNFNIVDGPSTINWAGFGANAYQATAFATLRGTLADALVTNLNNTVAGSPGDFTGGFQWNLEIGVGQSATIYGGFTLNGAAIPAPGATALFGLAGLAGVRRRR